jgi:hypothetical protein
VLAVHAFAAGQALVVLFVVVTLAVGGRKSPLAASHVIPVPP